MIRAEHIPFFVWFFNFYTELNLRKYFSRITVHQECEVSDLPLLIIGNHFSWWDGFFVVYLNTHVFRRSLYIMMLEEQLKHRKFLSKAGAFSIKKGTRSVIESMDYCIDILKDPGNLLALYPQGTFQSSYQFPFRFERGIMRIIDHAQNSFQLIFLASLTDYFSSKKPRLDFYLQTQNPDTLKSLSELEAAYNVFYSGCVKQQQE